MGVRKICSLGAGYISGSSSAVIALKCPNIITTVADEDSEKIMRWNSEEIPIHEQELRVVVRDCRNKNLFFSTDVMTSIKEADLIFICVDVPLQERGPSNKREVDLRMVDNAARLIANAARSEKIVVDRSFVALRSFELITKVLKANSQIKFQVLSNPEFFSNDASLQDYLFPERIIIGGDCTKPEGTGAVGQLCAIYEHWVPREKILIGNVWSSCLCKLAVDAFLADRISISSALYTLCEATGADISQISKLMEFDSRMGNTRLNTGLRLGNGNFKKNLITLVYLCESLNLSQMASYWQSVLDMQTFRTNSFLRKISHSLFGLLRNRIVTIFGFAEKNESVEMKMSPTVEICNDLLKRGGELHIYDPEMDMATIMNNLKFPEEETLTDSIRIFNSPYAATANTHIIIICTQEVMFASLDYNRIFSEMLKPAYIFDGQNILPHEKLKKTGFLVETIDKHLTQKIPIEVTQDDMEISMYDSSLL